MYRSIVLSVEISVWYFTVVVVPSPVRSTMVDAAVRFIHIYANGNAGGLVCNNGAARPRPRARQRASDCSAVAHVDGPRQRYASAAPFHRIHSLLDEITCSPSRHVVSSCAVA